MALNKSTGNMYDWITNTWNVLKGECPHACTYCYMKRWGKQKPLRFDEKELRTDLGTGNFIFVGSGCDMFANDIPLVHIDKIIDYCNKFDNKYLLQTKNPSRLLPTAAMDEVNEKFNICTTIETNRQYTEMGKAPIIAERAEAMSRLAALEFKTYVTIEPIMDFDLRELLYFVKKCKPIQVNIGADSGNNHLPEPEPEKIKQLITALGEFTIVKQKSNLKRLYK